MSVTDIAIQQSNLNSYLTSPVTKETQTLRDSVEKAILPISMVRMLPTSTTWFLLKSKLHYLRASWPTSRGTRPAPPSCWV